MTTKRERKTLCLCCGQDHPGYRRANPLTQPELEINMALLEGLGYSRETLLDKHLDQLDWQLPGMATWLRGQ